MSCPKYQDILGIVLAYSTIAKEKTFADLCQIPTNTIKAASNISNNSKIPAGTIRTHLKIFIYHLTK